MPIKIGYGNAPAFGVSFLPCVGALAFVKSDASGYDTTTIYIAQYSQASNKSYLFRLVGGAFENATRGGTYYNGGYDWHPIVKFGNYVIAAKYSEPMQAALDSPGVAFTDIASAPKAKLLIATDNFLIAFNTDDAVYGQSGDRWWCSAYQTHSDWVPSITTQATTGRIIAGGGVITAAAKFGSGAICWKQQSMFYGSYVGAPAVWQWDMVPGDIGCVGPEAVAEIGGALVFVSSDNIWLYDGTRPVSIADGHVRVKMLSEWSELDADRAKTKVMYDRVSGLVWICLRTKTTGIGSDWCCLAWHIQTKRWGRNDFDIQAVVHGVPAGAYNNSGKSAMFANGEGEISCFVTSKAFASIYGYTVGYATLACFGDNSRASYINRVNVRMTQQPYECKIKGIIRNSLQDDGAPVSEAYLVGSQFDLRQNAKWHQFSISFSGDFEIEEVSYDIAPAGKR